MLRKEMAQTLKFRCVFEIIWNDVLVDPSNQERNDPKNQERNGPQCFLCISLFIDFYLSAWFSFVIPSGFLLKLGQHFFSLS